MIDDFDLNMNAGQMTRDSVYSRIEWEYANGWCPPVLSATSIIFFKVL